MLATAFLAAVPGLAAAPARAAFLPQSLRVDGGEDSWHAQRQFALRWSNPPGVAAVHYRVLDPGGSVAVEEKRLGWPATSIQPLGVPPVPGAYTAEVWLEAADGGEGERAQAMLRFDDAAPADVSPVPVSGWIGRTAFPHTIRIGHPPSPLPLSGIRGYAISVDGSPSGDPCAGPVCTDAEIDLRGGTGEDSLALADLPEGTSYVHAVAVSGAGVPSAVPGSAPLRVDETDPLSWLEGNPAGWTSAPVTLTVRSADAASGMVATGNAGPFTAIRVDDGAPVTTPGDSATATVIGSGEHTVAYYARDAAGNVADGGVVNGHANHPPTTATVRIDGEPPRIAFAPSQDPSDPERIEAKASDRHSGIDPARGTIAVRRAVAGERFSPLPTEVADGALRAHWNSDAYPPGTYEFRATAYDRAGNATSTTSRIGGGAMRLSSPLRLPVRVLADTRSRAVRYGRGLWFGGRAIAGRASPLPGAQVEVIERFDAGATPLERQTTARTDARGHFGVHLSAGPSREVTARIAPTRTLRGTRSEAMRLTVKGRVALRASARTAKVGGAPLVFDGKVAAEGARIPAEGKVVELQFRLPETPWREFRTVHSDARGRFRYAYRFADDDSRGVRFQFRAYAPAQAGWPFEPAGSAPVTVLGT